MSLTVDKKSNEATVSEYKGTPFQKFSITVENGKYALVLPKNNNALCIFGDKIDNDAKVVMDPGQHKSSWFDIITADKGPYAKKGYIIKTHSNGKALDIAGGKVEEGKSVIQYNVHQNGNQVWLLVSVQEPKPEKHKKEEGDVAPKFKAKEKSFYKILPGADPTRCLTVDPNTWNVNVRPFEDSIYQKFSISTENDKFYLTLCGHEEKVCISKDRKDKSAIVVADKNKRNSTLFDIVRS